VEELLRIGELAKRSGVPIATLKHYIREGLIAPTKKSGRTMSWYAPALAGRVQAIKELQQDQFLPLDVIRAALDGDAHAPDELAAAEAIAKVLARHSGKRAKTRAEILERRVARDKELDVLAELGLAVPGKDGRYRGDDLALLSTLGAARQAGITADMLPFVVIGEYLAALRTLVAAELKLFRDGVIKRAPHGDVERLTTVATELSERLVVLIRRKLLLPTLQKLIEEDHAKRSSRPARRSVQQQSQRAVARRRPRRERG
jgi:DNA-binding transcriptional MerR regulator